MSRQLKMLVFRHEQPERDFSHLSKTDEHPQPLLREPPPPPSPLPHRHRLAYATEVTSHDCPAVIG